MQADRAKVTRLLRTAQGQIAGVLKMVDEDRYCIDISNQILAAAAMLEKANREVLHAHMRCCIAEAVQSGNADAKIDELLAVFDKAARGG